ncbi:MAG: O-antigen ligase family protein, partial [Chloroflexota bacterium]
VDTARGGTLPDRVLIYESALRMFRDRPLLGFGPDSFGVAYLRYREPGSEAIFNFERHNSAHDWILQTAVTTGAVGLAALATLIAVFARSLWALSARKAVIGGALLAGLAAYWAQGLLTVGSISVDWSPWVAFGAAAAARGALPAIGYRPRRAVGMHVAVAVAALIGAASVGGAFRASTDAKTAALQTQAGKGPAAVVAAASAVRLDPGRSEYWVQLGRARAAAGSEREAGDAYAEATTRDPWNPDYWQHLAASRARLAIAGDRSRGGAEAALAASARVVQADPNTSGSHFHLATVAYNLEDMRTALRSAVRAIELYQGNAEYDRVAALAATKLGDAEARALLESALARKESAALRLALAEVALRLNDRSAARANAVRALELDPQSEDAAKLIRSIDGN